MKVALGYKVELGILMLSALTQTQIYCKCVKMTIPVKTLNTEEETEADDKI